MCKLASFPDQTILGRILIEHTHVRMRMKVNPSAAPRIQHPISACGEVRATTAVSGEIATDSATPASLGFWTHLGKGA